MKTKNKVVRILFAIRIVLWVVALGATVYWIRWSFKIYEMGIQDVHEYAAIFRPIFARGLLISAVAIILSFTLRKVGNIICAKNPESH